MLLFLFFIIKNNVFGEKNKSYNAIIQYQYSDLFENFQWFTSNIFFLNNDNDTFAQL